MAGVSLTLLGCFEARLRPGGFVTFPKKTQALLAYLGLRPGQAYARDHLAALLWGETGDKQAYKSLRQAMYVLHKALPAAGPPILVTRSGTIALDPTAVDVDVSAFERLLAEGTPDALHQAAGLYRGDLVEGLNVDEAPFQEWITVERERLRELALEVLGKLLAQQSSGGQTERGIQTAVRLLALDPLQESVHRSLMHLYAAQGRRGAALKQYQVCVAALQRELGTEPEPATRQFYQEILQRRSVEAPKIATPHRRRSAAGPRVGLVSESSTEPITSEVALLGREAELSRLRAALDAAERGKGQVVAIVGEAGIGKSSVLTALAAHARHREVRGLLGFSYESEQVLAFGPWVEALRYAQLTEHLDVFNGLTPAWHQALAHLVPELTSSRQAPTLSLPDHLRLFEAVTGLVRHLATHQPVLVMLEDVHWADEMSVRLFAFLARRIRTSRVLVAVTIRGQELASAPILGQVLDELRREPHFVQITLCPAAVPLLERVRRAVASRLQRLGERGRLLASVGGVMARRF